VLATNMCQPSLIYLLTRVQWESEEKAKHSSRASARPGAEEPGDATMAEAFPVCLCLEDKACLRSRCCSRPASSCLCLTTAAAAA